MRAYRLPQSSLFTILKHIRPLWSGQDFGLTKLARPNQSETEVGAGSHRAGVVELSLGERNGPVKAIRPWNPNPNTLTPNQRASYTSVLGDMVSFVV